MQGTRRTPRVQIYPPVKMAEIASAVRALCVIYNTSLTYETSHLVFQKAVEERIPVFTAALAGLDEIPLFFIDGQTRVGAIPLEPGSAMFQKISREFEKMGVSSISLLPGVSAEDLRKLMKIINTNADDIPVRGLQHYLSQNGVKCVAENRVKMQMVDKNAKSTDVGAHVVASDRRHIQASTAWDIGDGTPVPRSQKAQMDMTAYSSRPMKDFVKGAIDALSRNEARLEDVADIISAEFEHRLNEKVDEVKKAAEHKVRRLEHIKDLVLKELETMNLPAVILDAQLRILSANRQGREIVGEMTIIDRTSPLGVFILSQQERQQIEVNGVIRPAHLLTCTSRESGESLMLLSFD